MVTYALLDSGATCSGVSKRVANRLGLPIRFENRRLSTFNYQGNALRELTKFSVQSLDRATTLEVSEALVGEILTTEKESVPSQDDIEKYPFMDGVVSFEELDDNHVGVILSARFAYTWELGERLSDGPDRPIAVKTAFGWGLIGANTDKSKGDMILNCCAMEPSISEDIDKMLRYDFTMRAGEKFSPEQDHPSQNDLHAIKQFEETITFDKNLGHFRCGVSWVKDRESAAKVLNQLDSATNAKNRLKKEAARMHRDPARKEGVWKQIQEIIDEGHAREVTSPEVPEGVPVYHLPLHIVTRPDKPGKWRVCQDAASKLALPSKDLKVQYSLNDFILAGPDLLNRLIGVLLRFRRHPVVLSADIRAFFHQIYMDERDIPAFRFYWFKDKELTVMAVYEMCVHIFGACSSPAVSTFVLRYLGKMLEGKVSPEVVWAIIWAFYVDDLIASFPDVATARRVRIELHESLLQHGFELCKYKSTHKGVLDEKDEKAAEEAQEKLLEDPKAEVPTEKVLGVAYNFQSDKFSIKIGKRAENKVSTRRELLSLTASIFDPNGFATPATLKGKNILQAATALGLDWDDLMSEEMIAQVDIWRGSLKELEALEITRWLATIDTTDGVAELHVFADASIEGYGIVVYLRIRGKNGKIHVALVFSRAHVVPLDMVRRITKDSENHNESVPRLELTAGRLAAEVNDMIIREFRDTIDIKRSIMWTDSETLIKWIRDRKTRFKTFVRNRLTKIHELTKVEDWRWVPSEDNPADDCSRGLNPSDKKWGRFINGPDFLWQVEEKWPSQKPFKPSGEIVINALTAIQPPNVKYDWAVRIAVNVGEWPAKVKRVATFVNFIKLWQKNHRKVSLKQAFPTVNDLNKAGDKLISGIQQEAFSKEIESLNKQLNSGNHQELKRASVLMPLNPFIDSIGLLRAGGRMSHSTNISYDMKYPKILPRDDVNIAALIRAEHVKQGHAGTNHVFSTLSQSYWIINGREAVKSVIHKCIPCQKNFKTPGYQKMADLPADRIDICVAFESTAIDCFGPYLIKNSGRGANKRWVVLFTCMSSRAVHFEILQNLSSSNFLNALVRFHARRPGLRVLYSDRGTNFKGADHELQKVAKEWNESTAGDLLSRGIEWKYSPPNSPHCGGIWERIIKGAKKHLTSLIGERKLDHDLLSTVLVEVERIMNSRPLTYASSDIRDLSVLTPANFLYPGIVSNTSLHILPPAPPGGETLRYQWQKARSLIDEFWSRWSSEYLHTLQTRKKWQKTQHNLYIGQIVLIVDENLPRDQWKIGRVEAIGPTEERVRNAQVKTVSGKVLERHVTKLVALELE